MRVITDRQANGVEAGFSFPANRIEAPENQDQDEEGRCEDDEDAQCHQKRPDIAHPE